MPDDGSPSSHSPAAASKSTGFATGINASSGHGHALRRGKNMDDGRRKSRSEASLDGTPPGLPRRGSNLSDYNLEDARNVLNPKAAQHQEGELSKPESSSLASLSLAFALLPALAGVLFKDGHQVTTDVMLLGLSGVFLHWSVTQPWIWYHAAQQVRIQQEADSEVAVVDEDSEVEDPGSSPAKKNTSLYDVPEESQDVAHGDGSEAKSHSDDEALPTAAAAAATSPQQQAALRELYMHEILALLSCFLLPMLSAYLLHSIRAQLSRPSEGLVSNYNLSIFLLVSELRAFSHTWKLLQSRTLHLQRLVHGNPFASSAHTGAQVEDVLERVERLEARSLANEFIKEHSSEPPGAANGTLQDKTAALARDVRNAIQPELDALNRAVRRYEKKATLLQYQTESRFLTLDSRLDDAIALAAVAAKNSSSKNILLRAIESLVAIVLFPFTTLLQLLMLPFRSISALLSFNKKRPTAASRHSRAIRLGKQPAQQARYGVPSRVMKR